jgi:hypothetical protein
MKNFMLLAAITIVLFACKTEKATINWVGAGLTGTWDLVMYSGGIAGGTRYPTSPEAIQFTSDSLYTRFRGGLITMKGSYHIHLMATPVYSPTAKDSVITYITSTMQQEIIRQSYSIKSRDTLFLNDYGISDGFSYKYVRRK